jgi:hypothetical protein
MKPNDPTDPQQTLAPGSGSRRRITVTDVRTEDDQNGTPTRRLKFGTPIRQTLRGDANAAEVSASVQRGFQLGNEPRVDAQVKHAAKPGVQPWILVVAAGALVLLALALLLRPSSASSAESAAQQKLVAQYTKYLESKGAGNSINIPERKKEVVDRLQAVAWAKAVGDRNALENELSGLLFLDDDKNSPLYQYSINQLKQLGVTKRRPGLQ